VTYINQTKKINVGGILIEYEGEDSGIGLLFASKAAIQVILTNVIFDLDLSQIPLTSYLDPKQQSNCFNQKKIF
jgi:hypothetical protein